MRSLDAIHLASAILDGTDVIVSYDTRLIDAAAAIGLETASPS
ncbi:MAG: hypothetical protein LBU05_05795 [Bifidobacteriaceae bacterium]|nr:hypothetical protein [Bifidobacteriaceae bacterium]